MTTSDNEKNDVVEVTIVRKTLCYVYEIGGTLSVHMILYTDDLKLMEIRLTTHLLVGCYK